MDKLMAKQNCPEPATWAVYEQERFRDESTPEHAFVGRFCERHAYMYDAFCLRYRLNPEAGFRCEEASLPPITHGPLCGYWYNEDVLMCGHSSCYAIVSA